jgi:hypothetical protein
MVDTETYAEMEQALLDALDKGRTPVGWNLTSQLYSQLDYGGDHFATAARAIHYGEKPKALYQLPVSLSMGAHHSWKLRTQSEG